MMKKMVSMAMAAVMALTLMVAVAPVEVKANGEDTTTESTETTSGQETTVYYTNSSALGDKDETSGVSVVVTIPATLTIDEDSKTGSANITLEAAANNDLAEYTRQAVIGVTSNNTWNLKTADGGSSVAYSLTYDGAVMADNGGLVGTLSAEKASILGQAKVTGTATVLGDYTDILTYTITFSDITQE